MRVRKKRCALRLLASAQWQVKMGQNRKAELCECSVYMMSESVASEKERKECTM